MRLSKHHGLGNDFLVVVDPDLSWPIDAPLVRALCDRRLGIGADGVIRATPLRPDSSGGAPVKMELRNADGSRAEMSGNGLRCMVQAVLMASMVDGREFAVETDAGRRQVSAGTPSPGQVVDVTLGMGTPSLSAEPSWHRAPVSGVDPPGWEGRSVSIGNPHLVLWVEDGDQLDGLPLERLGPALEASTGSNIEWIASDPRGGLVMRVWERGVGITQACGTGSVAAAAAARAWGRVGDAVTVRNPGGELDIRLGGQGNEARLSGPAAYVATVEVEPAALLLQHANRSGRPLGATAGTEVPGSSGAAHDTEQRGGRQSTEQRAGPRHGKATA